MFLRLQIMHEPQCKNLEVLFHYEAIYDAKGSELSTHVIITTGFLLLHPGTGRFQIIYERWGTMKVLFHKHVLHSQTFLSQTMAVLQTNWTSSMFLTFNLVKL